MKTLKELEREEYNRAIDKYRKPFLEAMGRKSVENTGLRPVLETYNDLETTPRPARGSSTPN